MFDTPDGDYNEAAALVTGVDGIRELQADLNEIGDEAINA